MLPVTPHSSPRSVFCILYRIMNRAFCFLFAVIIVGSIAIFLFLVLLAHLIFKAYKIWKGNRSRTGYRLLTRKYRKQKKSPAPSRFVLPKFSVSFPTSPLHVQLEEKGAGSASSHSGTEDSSGKRKDKKILKLQQRRRRYGVQEQDDLPSLKEIEARRKRRVFSESDIFMLTNPLTAEAPDKKRTRAKSEQVEMHRQRRMTLQPTLPVVSEASGHIECYFFYESEKKSLEIKVLQIFDIDEISPEIFRDRFALYDIGELPRKLKEPCLVRLKSDVVIFSDPSQLGMCVEITTFPRKRHIGTTELKYGLTSQTFEESFRLENRSLEQLHGKVVRLQVLLNYGKQPQIPVIIGEAIASLKHLKTDLVSPFRDCLVLPTDEKELEVYHYILKVEFQVINKIQGGTFSTSTYREVSEIFLGQSSAKSCNLGLK